MGALETFLTFLCAAVITANVLNIDSPEDSIIDDMNINGNQSSFSALIIMKNNKETEEIFLDSNEDKKTNTQKKIINHENVLNEDSDNDSDDDVSNEELTDHSSKLLRKKTFKGCLKKAAKVCKKACKEACQDACAYYDCKKKLKRRFKKECKRSCKKRFEDD